ncbi:MAG: FAD-binding protein, partial [Eggerthellaceae bacterium]|nr:FAD-binding protein [Eggerthellaceae bacterium]
DPVEGLKYFISASERTADIPYLTDLVNAGQSLNTDYLPTFPNMTVTKLGIFSPEYAALPGGSVILSYCNGGTGESQLWLSLQAGAQAESNVEFMYQTPGKSLITNTDGMVIGVVAGTAGGSDINIKAKKAVVLATGGYEYNEFLLQNSYPGWPPFSRGTPYNTGDGILMAQKVGAGLWHMNASDSGVGAIMAPGLNYGNGAYDSDGVPVNCNYGVAGATANRYICVSKHGKRFMSESREDAHGYGRREYLYFYDGVACEWPNLPFWLIFDSVQAQGNPVGKGANDTMMSKFTWFASHSNYTWSSDNSAEVTKGWILKSDTIADLADQMTKKQANERTAIYRDGVTVDPAVLEKTINDYNAYCAAGNDPDFGRNPASMVALEGPFYAVQVYPNQYNTQGGPKRNSKAQTLDAFDQPIPHLYNVGECGAGYGWVYNGGWNNAEAMITGIWAGENGSAETAWDE